MGFYIFFGKISIQITFPFLLELSFHYWVVRVLYILWVEVTYWVYDLRIFSPILGVVFSFSRWCLLKCRSFSFWLTPISVFYFLLFCVLLMLLRKNGLTQPGSFLRCASCRHRPLPHSPSFSALSLEHCSSPPRPMPWIHPSTLGTSITNSSEEAPLTRSGWPRHE